MTKMNENGFLSEDYPANTDIGKYLSTNQFNRKGDGLAKLTYDWRLSKKISIKPGLLGIYHFADDSYLNASKMRLEIAGSKGLTLNGTVLFNWRTGSENELELAAGAPFIARDNRPDGLTRHFVAMLGYKFSF